MGSNAKIAVYVAEPASASTTSGVDSVGHAVLPLFVRTTSGAKSADYATAPLSASTISGAIHVGYALPPRFASTISNATIARNVTTSHAPFKGAYSLAIASAAHQAYCSTCAENTVVSPRRSLKSKN